MQPPAHRPFVHTPAQLDRSRRYKEDYDLFFDNLDVILSHEQTILQCDEYFFCRPEFATYGIYCSRQIPLGILLLGWRHGIFRDFCCAKRSPHDSRCTEGLAYVHFFGGLASGVWWRGYCTSCKQSARHGSNTLFWERLAFAESAYNQFTDWTEVLDLEHFRSQKFSFGEPAIVPTTRGRMARTKVPLVQAVTVAQLVDELKGDHVRPPTPPDRTLIKDELVVIRNGVEVERFRLLE